MTVAFDFVQTLHRLDAARWGAPWGIVVSPAAIAGETPDEALAGGLRVLVVPSNTARHGAFDAGMKEVLGVGGLVVLTFATEARAAAAVPHLRKLARPAGGDA